MLSQDLEQRINFALVNMNNIFERLEDIEESICYLEYTMSLLSKRIDGIER